MRLGDLDALKEEISSWGMNDYEPADFIDAIDAAPTVVVDCKNCDGYEAGYSAGLKDAERPQDDWVSVSERLPEEKLSGGAFGFDFEEVLCTTIWGDVRVYKFGKPKGHDKPHFWLGGGIMDKYVVAWQYKPEPYTEKKNTNFYTKRFNEVN